MLNWLSEKLQIISAHPGIEVTITYFVPDEKKAGRAYVSYCETVRIIDDYKRKLVVADKTEIPIDQISEIESSLFDEMGINE